MENLSLMERFANPDLIHNMTMGEKVLASAYVAILGMAVTFVALMILWGCIIVMSRMLDTNKKKKEPVKVVPKETVPQVETPTVSEADDEELVAVITAAIAASLNTSTHNIVVRNIVRVEDRTPAWNRAGRIEQMNQMM